MGFVTAGVVPAPSIGEWCAMGFTAADGAAATGDALLTVFIVTGVVIGLGLGCIVCSVCVVIPCP